ncbi:MAG: DUF262 domain-containing protein [Synergistaceae bacterium]|nr:DUF262 domain-containing protein [Synergistaceae bacterium]
MKIEPHEITVSEIHEGYRDEGEGGVYGYGGRLSIRPEFQREFIYTDEQQAKVIHSLRHNFPLNVMYWVRNSAGGFEMLDGQQRTISICNYLEGRVNLDGLSYFNLTGEERGQVLGYRLMIYICEGTDREKLDWFETINIAGEKLTEQERNNALFSGPWVTEARLKFSKRGCPAEREAADYLKGRPERQDYLETAIYWAAFHDGMRGNRKSLVERYMSAHQHDKDCGEMWLYFRSVIDWVMFTFPEKRRKLMQGIDWGKLYHVYGGRKDLNPSELEARISALLADDEVKNKQGIYEYILDGDERHLSLRKFPDRDKISAYERQGHKCAVCGKVFGLEEMEADHITPWSKGGKTVPDNCQVLCRPCNRKKGGR